MTDHFYEVKYPTEIGEGGLCNINGFFNCNATTHSPLSNLFGIPIALFGMFIGFFTLFGYLFNDEKVEGTLFSILFLNFVGCITLFLYSLIALGTLCPLCTLYYILSGILFYIFYKNGNSRSIGILPISIYAIVVVIASGISYNHTQTKENNKNAIAKDLIRQFEALPKLGRPSIDSPYMIEKSTEKFSDAPIRITKFSDFQCPACKMMGEILHKIGKKYAGKINIQYIFYPLDPECNADVQRSIHPEACFAAYMSACLPEKFSKVHDDIFNNQKNITFDWVEAYANKEGVTKCYKDPKTKQKVMNLIKTASPFNIRSTPTILLNGVKIEGVLGQNQLEIIIDHILSKK